MIAGNTELSRHSTLFSSQNLESEEQADDIDFKMVTFSLGGKEYGIDIMKVKEIAKFENFTYVPNTQPFVSGVYNLRGDIISVIDMRIMFNLPATRSQDGVPQDGLIIRLDSGLIGVVVDRIDKVVGITSESVQPPHPIFADINIKYISGVVEHDERLYIILDVDRILGDDVDEPAAQPQVPDAARRPAEERPAPGQAARAPGETADMVAQTLQTLSGFTMTDLNRAWVEQRLDTWKRSHNGSVQITTQDEVDEFLSTFYSAYTGRFWEEDYLSDVRALLAAPSSGNANAWNPGCGKGYEAYSIAVLLREQYPEARIKVWAGDNDLLNVSTAPNLVFDRMAVPEYYVRHLVEGNNGFTFSADIKQIVTFEFSDVTHSTAVPPCELIVIRDVLSFLSERDQRRVIAMIEERAREETLIITGGHEDLSVVGSFRDVSRGQVRAFKVK